MANCKHDIKCCLEMRFESPKCVQMRLRLGQEPRWGSLQRSPRLPSWICGEKREGDEGPNWGERLLHGAEAMDASTELIMVIETQTN